MQAVLRPFASRTTSFSSIVRFFLFSVLLGGAAPEADSGFSHRLFDILRICSKGFESHLAPFLSRVDLRKLRPPPFFFSM